MRARSAATSRSRSASAAAACRLEERRPATCRCSERILAWCWAAWCASRSSCCRASSAARASRNRARARAVASSFADTDGASAPSWLLAVLGCRECWRRRDDRAAARATAASSARAFPCSTCRSNCSFRWSARSRWTPSSAMSRSTSCALVSSLSSSCRVLVARSASARSVRACARVARRSAFSVAPRRWSIHTCARWCSSRSAR
mmetsp:Transcript_15360/g.23839  ORF Transcript_15360/g.23839 Transcript_15360/m.23839 type:complete len:205 (-) Transcript_15360:391-1005(-)